MNEYRVQCLSAAPDWAAVEKMAVTLCPWGGDYRPQSFAQMTYEVDKGFHLRMGCRESDPRAVYTQPDDPVCRDSCLESFIDFAPAAGVGYVNLEANAAGAALLAIGPARQPRRFLRALGCPLPALSPWRQAEEWGWRAFIPLATVQALYPVEGFAPGDVLRGNFYKCGDDTAVEHYCVWNPIDAPAPDFHRPECFGRLLLV